MLNVISNLRLVQGSVKKQKVVQKKHFQFFKHFNRMWIHKTQESRIFIYFLVKSLLLPLQYFFVYKNV